MAIDNLRGKLPRAEMQRDALLRFIRDHHPVCDYCEETPACIGTGEGNGVLLVACDNCCGHGDDDGWCLMLDAEDDDADD